MHYRFLYIIKYIHLFAIGFSYKMNGEEAILGDTAGLTISFGRRGECVVYVIYTQANEKGAENKIYRMEFTRCKRT